MKLTYLVAGALLVTAGLLAGSSQDLPMRKNMFGPATAFAQVHQHGVPAKDTKTQKTAVPEKAPPGQPAQKAAPAQPEQETPLVEIPLEKQQLIGVKTSVAAVKPLQKVIRTVGRVEQDERRSATVTTKFEGYLERLYVDYTGRLVKKGEPVAEIYSPEIYATQQEYLNLIKWTKTKKNDAISEMLAKDAEAIVDAARQRLRLWDITDEQIKEIEASGKPIRRLTIYSPVSGHVTQKMVVEGMRIMPGEKLFEVTDFSTVWVVADIYEFDIPLVKPGQTAEISLSYFPGKVFTSKADYIYPTLAGDTRTARVRFSIPNPGGILKPQMYTNVELKVGLGKRLTVPEDAIIDTGLRQVIYVDKGEGQFEPREVSVGIRAEGVVEITGGLKAGEKIATGANFLIDSEAKLKGVKPLPRAAAGPGTKPKPARSEPPPAHKH